MKNKFLLFVFIVFSFVTVQLVSAQGSVIIPNPISAGDFEGLLMDIAAGVGTIIVSLGALMIIISGFLFMTSAGNPEKLKTAKTAFGYAIIGIIIGGLATGIVNLIEDTLR